VFAFSHRSEETWRDGQLMSLRSETVEHGENLHVEGAATPDGFRVVSRGGPFIASAATLTSNSLWTPAVLEQETAVDAQHGGIIGVSARKFADEDIVIGGRPVRATRFGIGKSGAGYTYTRDVLLELYGWMIPSAERVLEFGPADQNEALCNNKVDAIIFEAGHPNGLTQEATTGCRARLVRVTGPPVDRLLATHSDYIASVIPGGMYAGNPDDVPTISTLAVLVTSSAQPDELAYGVVKAVFENLADFRRLHPALATLDIKAMVPSEAVMPIHPGALKYYREAALVH